MVGAGAIGGLLGVKLALAGHEVALVARGPHLETIRSGGLRLLMGDRTEHVAREVVATADIRACGVQDLVILGVKAHSSPRSWMICAPSFTTAPWCCPPRTGSLGGTSTGSRVPGKGACCTAWTPAGDSSRASKHAGSSAASSIRRRRSKHPASSATSRACASRWGSSMAAARNGPGRWPACWWERASSPTCSTTCAPRSCSRPGAICPSIRSAPSPTPPWRISAASRRREG